MVGEPSCRLAHCRTDPLWGVSDRWLSTTRPGAAINRKVACREAAGSSTATSKSSATATAPFSASSMRPPSRAWHTAELLEPSRSPRRARAASRRPPRGARKCQPKMNPPRSEPPPRRPVRVGELFTDMGQPIARAISGCWCHGRTGVRPRNSQGQATLSKSEFRRWRPQGARTGPPYGNPRSGEIRRPPGPDGLARGTTERPGPLAPTS